ncbi:MAG: glycosyltransferase family 9 protein [Ignavibacteria bacterium]|nr:glycosyltransferase family 9 protein [Ignavibacteria bacterium]
MLDFLYFSAILSRQNSRFFYFVKKFELLVKSIFKPLIFKTFCNCRPKIINGQEVDFTSNVRKILILRQDRIGDLLVSVPFLRALRNHLPTSTIHILLSYRNLVAKSCILNYVDQVFCFPKNIISGLILVYKLRRQKYDLVIDLFDNPSFTSSFVINFIKPRFSLGFDKENRKVYTHIVFLPNKMDFHIIDRICFLLIAFGIEIEKVQKNLEYPVKENTNKLIKKGEKRVGVVLTGSTKSKFWGLENFYSLIRLIISNYPFEIIIFPTYELRKELSKFQTLENVYIAPINQNFDEFAEMISECDFLVSPDTSVVHLASAFNIPIVVFYQFIGEKYGMPWYPYKTRFKAILSKEDSYTDISPLAVFSKFCDLVEGK